MLHIFRSKWCYVFSVFSSLGDLLDHWNYLQKVVKIQLLLVCLCAKKKKKLMQYNTINPNPYDLV